MNRQLREALLRRLVFDWQDLEVIADMAKSQGVSEAEIVDGYRRSMAHSWKYESLSQIDVMISKIEKKIPPMGKIGESK